MAERKKLEFISSVTIMNTPMKKQKFIVDEMIYPGLHILSGDPKIGKSWLVRDRTGQFAQFIFLKMLLSTCEAAFAHSTQNLK